MSSDFSEFAEPGFDVKAWINRACGQAQTDEEPLDRHLAELEMRLQLTAEEIEASLHELSVQAMRRIPFAVQEIYRLQGDIQGMQDQMHGLASGIKRDAASASESVTDLKQLDRVKSNMESACSTLKEATELSSLFVKVEEVFAAGDLPRVADMLSSMRRSLSLVGDVPEFRAGRQKLHQLEDRLQGLIEGSLADALAASTPRAGAAGAAAGSGATDETVRQLAGLLLAVDRLSTIDNLYCSSRCAAVAAKWDELSAAAAAAAAAAPGTLAGLAWLPHFLAWLTAFLEEQAAWCGRVLPAHQPQLMAGLCRAALRRMSGGIKEALAAAPVAAQLKGPGAMAALVGLQRELAAVATAVAELVKGSEVQVRKDILGLVFLPIEDKVATYGTLEQAQLVAELAVVPKPPSPSAGPVPGIAAEEVVAHVSAASRLVLAAMHQSVDRCIAFTGGTELRTMMRVVDHELSTQLNTFQALVSALHERQTGGASATASTARKLASQTGADAPGQAGVAAAPGPGSVASGMAGMGAMPAPGALGYGEDSEEVAATLRLLLVHADVSAGLNRLEADIRTTISSVVPRLDAAAERGRAAAPDAVALRLDAFPDKLSKSHKLLEAMLEPRFIALPGAAAALDALHAAVQATLLDALLAKVKAALAPLPSMPDWKRGGAAAGSAAVALPSFNSYPLAYVTAIGEYLMTLPQQLEVLISQDESPASGAIETDVEELAAEWLDKVVTAAAALYTDQILLIPELGQQGGSQLAADAEYFCNVVAALHGTPPPSLLTVQLFAGQPPAQFAEAARQAAAEGGADLPTLRMLATMRHLPPP